MASPTPPTWRIIALLSLLAAGMYLSCLGIIQLRMSDEALTAAIAQDMVSSGDFFKTHLYGKPVSWFPLYAQLTCLCSLLHLPNAWTLRLPSVLALFGIALASGLFARKIQSGFAGIVAAAAVVTTLISFRALRAQNEVLASVFLCIAWYWFYLKCGKEGQHLEGKCCKEGHPLEGECCKEGQPLEGKRWKERQHLAGWSVAMVLVFLATTAVGAKAPIIFYLPLYFFCSSKETEESNSILTALEHLYCLCGLITALLAWILIIPCQPFMPWSAWHALQDTNNLESYTRHLVSMLPKCLLYLFPWVFLEWTPYCLALRRFEQDKHCCRYLRMIILCNLIVFWFLPGGSPMHLFPVLGPVCVLLGVYAEIIVRRHCEKLYRLLRFSGYVVLVLSVILLAFWVCTGIGLVSIPGISQWMVRLGIVLPSVSILIIIFQVLLCTRHVRWARNPYEASLRTYLWLFFSCYLLYVVTGTFWDVHFHSERRMQGEALSSGNLEQKKSHDGVKCIHLYLPDSRLLNNVLVETFYLKTPIVYIKDSLRELPPDAPVVYLLSSTMPPGQDREWTLLGPDVLFHRSNRVNCSIQGINVPFTGKFPLVKLERISGEANAALKVLRLYRGKRLASLPSPLSNKESQ